MTEAAKVPSVWLKEPRDPEWMAPVWVVPWRMYVDDEGRAWLPSDILTDAQFSPRGTARLMVELHRDRDRARVVLPTDERWTKGDPIPNTFIPVVEISGDFEAAVARNLAEYTREEIRKQRLVSPRFDAPDEKD